MPENFENDANYISKGEMRVTPSEVKMMLCSCESAAKMAERIAQQAQDNDDTMGVVAFASLQFGLKRCVAYFEEVMGQIEKAMEERKAAEPDLNELNDSDRS